MTPGDVLDVEAGVFAQCPRCDRWWHQHSVTLALQGPVEGVTGGPRMASRCPWCQQAIAPAIEETAPRVIEASELRV